jgi:hypothetical protein
VALVCLLAGLLLGGACGCQMMKNKQQREKFEKTQQEFSCGEPMPGAIQ